MGEMHAETVGDTPLLFSNGTIDNNSIMMKSGLSGTRLIVDSRFNSMMKPSLWRSQHENKDSCKLKI